MERREAIILAGGLGTRLRTVVPELPKCLAPVAGRPFLFYVINQLRRQGINRFIFSLGYRSETILEYLQQEFPTLNYTFVIEDEPLGTGGAIQLAARLCEERMAIVANGDTLYKADLKKAWELHEHSGAECSLLLKPMQDFERYGVVETNEKHIITLFREKQFYTEGNINGGLYILDVSSFLQRGNPEKFSFEKDFLEAHYNQGRFLGIKDDGYFIDIGIPEDFQKAQTDLLKKLPALSSLNKEWSLLIDRDGVINEEKKDGYILNWNEFNFYNGVPEALALLSGKLGRIIVITNQRGVGKGLMSLDDLENIHAKMREKIKAAGGRIDAIYYCTSMDNTHECRKPNPGMAFRAWADFPEIDPDKTIMIGNKPSDMRFARNAGIFSVFVRTTEPETVFPHPDIDWQFANLPDFANSLGN
jgi:D-glycero-alpha-D-manno-heptose 1-phosphate guanylyltransferase